MLDRLNASIHWFAGNAEGAARVMRPATAFDLAIASGAVVLVHATLAYSGLGAVVVRWANQYGIWNIERISLGLVVIMLIAAWYGVFRGHACYSDLRRRLRRERELCEAETDLDRAEHAVSAFLANLSHGLRTPLTSIMGFSDIIRNETFGPVGNAIYAEYVDNIRASSAYMLTIVDGLLDLAGIDAGMPPPESEPVDVARAIQTAVSAVAPRAQESNVHMILRIDDDLPRLLVGARDLTKIVVNLTSNAVTFNRAGGTVTIGARVDRRGKFIITVVDTGVGMTGQDIAQALSRYGRIDKTGPCQGQGAGLGLPLTKALVERYGGRLEIHSDPGVGTIAAVHFPASRVERPGPHSATAAAAA